jgi:5-methylthioadenosine/S-adenosylhomocysteine deaminase
VPGKAADLAAVHIAGPELEPCYDPISQLVYAAGRRDVSDVWVAGKRLLQGGIFLNSAPDFPFRGLDTRSKLWQNALSNRPGT